MSHWLNRTHVGDCRALMAQMAADGVKVQTCVTSPPYFGLRDYGHDGQIGLESSPAEYVAAMVDVFRAVREVLADDGTVWLNLGDSYSAKVLSNNNTPNANRDGSSDASSKAIASGLNGRRVCPDVPSKNLLGIPWRVAFALQADGWYLRQDIIWHKPNPMPESVRDRCTKAHEYVFLLAKSAQYYFDSDAISEAAIGTPGGNVKPNKSFEHDPVKHRTKAGLAAAQQRAREAGGFAKRNRRTVWTITTKPFAGAHFATFPPELVQPCILAGSRPGDVVLDPFMGSGTTGQVATDLGRQFIGCELNPAYIELHDMRRTTIGMPL